MEPEQTESNFLLNLQAWVEVNKRRLIQLGVGVLVLWLVIYTYTYFQRQQEVAAEEALSALFKAPLGNANKSLPDAAGLLAVADKHAGAPAGQRALLLAAGALFQQGKFAEAKAAFQKFSSQYPDSKLIPTAAYGVAACEDSAGNLEAALAAYQSVEQRFSKDPVTVQAKLARAVIFEARNKPEDAYKIYDEMAKPDSRSLWSSEAFSRKDLLLAKFPHLGIPPAPPLPTIGSGTNAPVMVQSNSAALMTALSNALANRKAAEGASNSAPAPKITITPVPNPAPKPNVVVTAVSNAVAPIIQVIKSNTPAVIIPQVKPAVPNAPVVPPAPTPKKP